MLIVRYLTLYQLKSFLGEDPTSTMYDVKFNQAINEASSLVDHIVRPRFFHPRLITSTYNAANLSLVRVHDLNEVLSWSIDGYVQPNNDPLEFEPEDGPPYSTVALRSNNSPFTFGTRNRSSLSITGFYGYLNQIMSLDSLDLDLDSASVTFNSTNDIPDIESYAGRYIRVDDELMFVTAVSGTKGFVVMRGINGSSVADHYEGATIYVWDPLNIVQLMTRTIATRIIQIPQGAGIAFLEASGAAPFGGVVTDTMMRDLEELAPVYGS